MIVLTELVCLPLPTVTGWPESSCRLATFPMKMDWYGNALGLSPEETLWPFNLPLLAAGQFLISTLWAIITAIALAPGWWGRQNTYFSLWGVDYLVLIVAHESRDLNRTASHCHVNWWSCLLIVSLSCGLTVFVLLGMLSKVDVKCLLFNCIEVTEEAVWTFSVPKNSFPPKARFELDNHMPWPLSNYGWVVWRLWQNYINNITIQAPVRLWCSCYWAVPLSILGIVKTLLCALLC